MAAAQGAAISVAVTTSQVAPTRQSKLTRTFTARKNVLARWRTQAAAKRDVSRPLVWFHAPSVGEGLQARPIIQALRQTRPDVQIAYSFFSPSAEAFAQSLDVDIVDYLPFDTTGNARVLLQALQPSAIFFVKLDVWPMLVSVANERNVPVGLLSATLSAESGRRGIMAQAVLHDAYASLNVVGAIATADAKRLQQLGVRAERIHVSGDTRFDQVWERAHTIDRDMPLLRALRSPRPTLVAGSTWPTDEAVLLRAWESVAQQLPSPRLVIAPHEPTAEHIAPIVAWAKRCGMSVQTLSEVECNSAAIGARTHADGPVDTNLDALADSRGATPDIVIVDRVGVLGALYALADVAYVGGGFHKAGLHSVIEPAAFGVPVVFGPGFGMSREAILMQERKAACPVADASECAVVLSNWLSDAAARAAYGDAARTFVHSEIGASQRSLELVLQTINTQRLS